MARQTETQAFGTSRNKVDEGQVTFQVLGICQGKRYMENTGNVIFIEQLSSNN